VYIWYGLALLRSRRRVGFRVECALCLIVAVLFRFTCSVCLI